MQRTGSCLCLGAVCLSPATVPLSVQSFVRFSLCLPASLPSPFPSTLPAVCWAAVCLSLLSASGPWVLASVPVEFGSPFSSF